VSVPLPEGTDGSLRLVVVGDSTSFTDASGPQLPDHPDLYPNVAARRLQETLGRPVAVTVIARAGHTVREATRTVTKDRHVQFDVLAGADAVVVGVGSFDHAPGGIPAVVDAVVPFVRPTALRRVLRRNLHRAYPLAVRATFGRRRRTAAAEFERLFAQLLDHVRGLTWGRAAGVVVGPISHRAAYYAHTHPGFAAAESHHLALARRHGFAPVPAWEHVEPHADQLNPDGIHWPAVAHLGVGEAVAGALLPQLSGAAPTIGLPPEVQAVIDAAAATDPGREEAPGNG
jgi:diglucosylglycerate octanoyltransferase